MFELPTHPYSDPDDEPEVENNDEQVRPAQPRAPVGELLLGGRTGRVQLIRLRRQGRHGSPKLTIKRHRLREDTVRVRLGLSEVLIG